MPVYWSVSSQTALAEFELEYNSNHKSNALYVSFELNIQYSKKFVSRVNNSLLSKSEMHFFVLSNLVCELSLEVFSSFKYLINMSNAISKYIYKKRK
jgi:hypothetical protein